MCREECPGKNFQTGLAWKKRKKLMSPQQCFEAWFFTLVSDSGPNFLECLSECPSKLFQVSSMQMHHSNQDF